MEKIFLKKRKFNVNLFRRIILLSLLFFLICSCGTYHIVKIDSDRSAIIEAYDYFNDSLRMTKSKVISDFKWKNQFFNFKISEIDSLGRYMGDIINNNYLTFRYYNDSIVISGNNNLPLKEKLDSSWFCCGYDLIIQSDKEIKKISTEGKHLRIRGKKINEAHFYMNLNRRKKINDRLKKIVIKF